MTGARPLLCIAHRGASYHQPENTLPAIRKALELGARAIEIDVWAIGGEVFVFHDRRLERLTASRGLLADCTIAEVRALRIRGQEPLPTLQEVLELVQGKALLNIELKGPETAAPVAGVLRHALAGGWKSGDLLVSSFRHGELHRFAALLPEVPRGAIVYGAPLDHAACATALQAWSIHAALEFVDRALVEDARHRGLRVFVYTVNHPDDLEHARALGVDGAFSDDPGMILEHTPQPDTASGWVGLPHLSYGAGARRDGFA